VLWHHVNFRTTKTITATEYSTAFWVGRSKDIAIFIVVDEVGGTGPTLDASLEAKEFFEAKWADTGKSFPTITAAGTYVLSVNQYFGCYLRLKFKIGGTTPSFKLRAYAQWLE